MVLFMIGLGLGDERDITLRGLEAIKGCSKVYLEAYTSILGVDKEKLARNTFSAPLGDAHAEALYGKTIEIADRECVEQGVDGILDSAVNEDVAFLVVGDPFAATTHTDLQLRAREKGAVVRVIHNASIMNAVAACGLQLYRFGQTVSIVFFTETWRPDSFYDRIAENRKLGLHTLCLLDIRVKEPSVEALCRGKKDYEPPRYMTVSQAAEQLLEVEENRKEGAYTPETMCVGVARIGRDDQAIIAAPLKDLVNIDFGAPLHSLVIVGDTHPIEDEALRLFGQQPAAER